MGFIGRTKRTIWMGSPSLHPTYSNFYIIQTHVERIPVRIQIETERHEAYCQFLKEAYFSFVCLFVISGCCAKRWICPFSVKHKPSAVRFKSIQSLSTAISKIDVCTFFPFFSYCLVEVSFSQRISPFWIRNKPAQNHVNHIFLPTFGALWYSRSTYCYVQTMENLFIYKKY